MPTTSTAPCQLILALDLPSKKEALTFLQPLSGELKWVKIGLQLFTQYGPSIVEDIAALGYRIFLDLKLHDIPNTVASAVTSLSRLPIELLTLHASGGSEMIQRAQAAQQEHCPQLQLLSVTVLTSFNEAALRETGVDASPAQQVERLGQLAIGAGSHGLVCSPHEISILRQKLGPAPLLVTPGVRPAGSALDEQKRVMTPAQAQSLGASHIVVGRPILKSADPLLAVQNILTQLHV